MRVQELKSWCENNLSPLAWSRILTKNLSHFNELGFYLKDLRDPKPGTDIYLDEDTVRLIRDSIRDLYHKELSIK